MNKEAEYLLKYVEINEGFIACTLTQYDAGVALEALNKEYEGLTILKDTVLAIEAHAKGYDSAEGWSSSNNC